MSITAENFVPPTDLHTLFTDQELTDILAATKEHAVSLIDFIRQAVLDQVNR